MFIISDEASIKKHDQLFLVRELAMFIQIKRLREILTTSTGNIQIHNISAYIWKVISIKNQENIDIADDPLIRLEISDQTTRAAKSKRNIKETSTKNSTIELKSTNCLIVLMCSGTINSGRRPMSNINQCTKSLSQNSEVVGRLTQNVS